MRTSPLTWLLLYLAATVLVGGLLAWPLHAVLATTVDWSFYRVLSRAMLLAALAGVPFFLRATGGTSRAQMGFACERRRFLRIAAAHFGVGLLTVAPLIGVLLGSGVRTLSAALPGEALAQLVDTLPLALLTGLVVGVAEEAYFRGAVMGALLARMQVGRALLASSAFFAVVHFLVAKQIPEELRWYSGFELVAAGLSDLLAPATVGAFSALIVAGVLLGAMRVRHGHIGACIGFHAGWVTGITAAHRLTDVPAEHAFAWLVGRPDGVMGWLALVWIGALTVVYFARARRSPVGGLLAGAPRADAGR